MLSSQTTLRSAAIGWRILQQMPLNTDSILVREVVGLGVALQLDDGGWPQLVRHAQEKSPARMHPVSCPLQTARVLLALDQAGQGQEEVAHRGIEYLVGQQQAAGIAPAWRSPQVAQACQGSSAGGTRGSDS